MENSEDDSMSRTQFSQDDDESPEESSWTMYFQDFFNENNNGGEEDRYGDRDYSSSLISDAASFVDAGKFARKDPISMATKKRSRNREGSAFLGSKDLEDTASSPSHSPKVYSMMEQLGHENQKGKDVRNTLKEKAGESWQIEEKNGMGSTEEAAFADLKKEGLCLVPLSRVTNYFG